MLADRLVSVRITGLRAFDRVDLPLTGLTVLIGENGVGKSTLVEGFEILRKASEPGPFLSGGFHSAHGGIRNLLRQGCREVGFAVRIEARAPDGTASTAPLDYSFAIGLEGTATVIVEERLDLHAVSSKQPLRAIWRDRSGCRVFDVHEKKLVSVHVQPNHLALTGFGIVPQSGPTQPAVARVLSVLSAVRIHVPFDVRPLWVSAEGRREPSRLRDLSAVDSASELARLGDNLANCLFTIDQSYPPEARERVLALARAGLGTDLVEIRTPPIERHRIGLQLKFSSLPDAVPASALSDGQLSYLALLALAEMSSDASLVVLDEPETHLHPGLLTRVVWMLERLSSHVPVMVATQSDRLLDALADPAGTVVLCELDERRATRLLRPDREALAAWLKTYSGLGALRAEGYEHAAFRADREPTPEPAP